MIALAVFFSSVVRHAAWAAAANFVWLAFVIERARGFDALEHAEMRSVLA